MSMPPEKRMDCVWVHRIVLSGGDGLRGYTKWVPATSVHAVRSSADITPNPSSFLLLLDAGCWFSAASGREGVFIGRSGQRGALLCRGQCWANV